MYNRLGVTGMSSLQNTVEKIKNLEVEKKSLLAEIDELKKMADAKVARLETEVASLREEAKMLKTIMAQGQLNQQPNVNQLKAN
jgi:uncharacterized protein (UPF0335 family)